MKQSWLLSDISAWIKGLIGLGFGPLVLAGSPALGTSSITAEYGIVERSVSVNSLKTYTEQGIINPDLHLFVRKLTPSQVEQLKFLLTAKVDLSEITVSQFLYTQQGETILRQLGEVIRTDADMSGFYAIRGAIILAAADSDGLTLLNVLEKFPLEDVRVDLNRVLQLSGELEALVRHSQVAIAEVEQQAHLEAAAQPWSGQGLPDLRSPGPFTWQIQTIQVNNPARDRSFPVDVYLPQRSTQTEVQPARVVVISHGLGGDRTTFAYLAQQLASYGFAVVVPEHPGSDANQIQALLSGEVSQVIEPTEFINRPLDVKYSLDTLTTLSQTDSRFRGWLDLQTVGVIGQSFGGYTALALAGATFNPSHLTTECSSPVSFNLALLLECQVRDLPHSLPNLQDSRVKAILVINPIGSSIFGRSGFETITIPVMVVSSSNDTVAPALIEQFQPFNWLISSNKYLALLQNGTHFSTIDTSNSNGDNIDLPNALIGPNPAIAYTYLKALSVALFETYSANDSRYYPYLSAAYAEHISQPLMPLDLVRSPLVLSD